MKIDYHYNYQRKIKNNDLTFVIYLPVFCSQFDYLTRRSWHFLCLSIKVNKKNQYSCPLR